MALLAANENIFTDEEVRMAIAPVSTFDPDYLDYYNFLEAIVRVAKARPWTEEEQAELPQFDAKLDKICDLQHCFGIHQRDKCFCFVDCMQILV